MSGASLRLAKIRLDKLYLLLVIDTGEGVGRGVVGGCNSRREDPIGDVPPNLLLRGVLVFF